MATRVAKNELRNHRKIADLLNNARDDGQNRIAQIVQTNPIRTLLPNPVVESYLQNAIEYRLTPAHRAGIDEFAARLRII